MQACPDCTAAACGLVCSQAAHAINKLVTWSPGKASMSTQFLTHLALHPNQAIWFAFCYTLEEGFEQSINVNPRLVHFVTLRTRDKLGFQATGSKHVAVSQYQTSLYPHYLQLPIIPGIAIIICQGI